MTLLVIITEEMSSHRITTAAFAQYCVDYLFNRAYTDFRLYICKLSQSSFLHQLSSTRACYHRPSPSSSSFLSFVDSLVNGNIQSTQQSVIMAKLINRYHIQNLLHGRNIIIPFNRLVTPSLIVSLVFVYVVHDYVYRWRDSRIVIPSSYGRF